MNMKNKWKKAAYLASAAGVLGLAAFGVFNTARAYDNFSQAPAADNTINTDTASENNYQLTGNVCSPYGCAGCPGCTDIQYQQNAEAIPDTTTLIK
jgi:hypothetical protein